MSRETLTEPIQEWLDAGDIVVVDSVEVYYQVHNQDQQQLPWLVCFHGFPTSSWDWHECLDGLKNKHRVLIFDFPGYGLSGKPTDRNYSLKRQLDAAEALMSHLGIRAFHLLAHDMGNSVACELLRRREQGSYAFELLSLTLLNGGIYMDLHKPLMTQRLLRTPVIGAITGRLSSYKVFRRQYPTVYAEPDRFDELHYRSQWALIQNNHGNRIFHKIAGYMKERRKMGDQWTGPLERLDLPLQVIWGKLDRIATFAIPERLLSKRSETKLIVLEDIGHYPQLETPERVAELVGSGTVVK